VDPRNEKELPFAENVYCLAAVLDPQFCLHWIDIDVQIDNHSIIDSSIETIRDEVKERFQSK